MVEVANIVGRAALNKHFFEASLVSYFDVVN